VGVLVVLFALATHEIPGVKVIDRVPEIGFETVDDVLGFERGDAPIDDPVERRLEALRQEGQAVVAGVEIRGRGDGPAEKGLPFAEEAVLADGLEVFGRREDFCLGHLGGAQDPAGVGLSDEDQQGAFGRQPRRPQSGLRFGLQRGEVNLGNEVERRSVPVFRPFEVARRFGRAADPRRGVVGAGEGGVEQQAQAGSCFARSALPERANNSAIQSYIGFKTSVESENDLKAAADPVEFVDGCEREGCVAPYIE
jgi:hypothetical protein